MTDVKILIQNHTSEHEAASQDAPIQSAAASNSREFDAALCQDGFSPQIAEIAKIPDPLAELATLRSQLAAINIGRRGAVNHPNVRSELGSNPA